MGKTWILIANGERARCFERHGKNHSFTELADFVNPRINIASQPVTGDRSGDAGKGHGRSGHAGTQFEPHTEVHAKDRGEFARQLMEYLDAGVAEQRYSELVLIASSAMLGQLRPLLSSAAEKALQSSVASDLTSFHGPELTKRINHAMRLSH